jgi:hypothetical protein
MGVAAMLGVEDVEAPPMMAARTSWVSWTLREPALRVVEDLLDLPGWTRTAGRERKDAALRSLARLGAADGGDDRAAVTGLTWMLVPGAATVARGLADLAGNIDELVASHLWTSARTFAWRHRRATAASILRDTRRGVLAELGVGEWARREDRAWAAAVPVEPASPAWQHAAEPAAAVDPGTELVVLLEDALSTGVITCADRRLLIDLAVAADRAAAPGRRGRAGLMVPVVSQQVADRWGMSSRSVRRRAARSIDQLAAFAAHADRTDDAGLAIRADLLALGA